MIRFILIFFCVSSALIAETTRQTIDAVILPAMKKENIPGVAVAVYDGVNGAIICYGVSNVARGTSVTPDTLFEIASITKVFTSTELALEVERGNMHLDDAVTEYLPMSLRRNPSLSQVTLQMLATHTSSLPRDMDRYRYTQFLQNWRPDYPIGERSLYSNFGFALLGYALENREHLSYEALLRRDVFNPLGMTGTYVDVPLRRKPYLAVGYAKNDMPLPPNQNLPWPGGGALKSSAADMLLFLKANLGIVRSSEVRAAMQLAEEGYFRVNDTLTLGLGWQRVPGVHKSLIIDKNGGLPGFSSYIGFVPEKKIGIVILANKNGIPCTALGRQILNRLQ